MGSVRFFFFLLLSMGLLPARQPNVVLIMADDLGYQDLGCYGHPKIKTPVLDQMASEGIRLTDFHSGATVCTPSRMALMTGVYPTRLGWTQGVVGFKMGVDDGMNSKALTIAEIFKSEGYATSLSGKWHIGNQIDTDPNAQGFDSAYYLTMSNNQTTKLWRDRRVVEDPFDNRLLTQQVTDEGKRFINENKDHPFFLYLAYTAPHFPVQPHPGWKGVSDFGKFGDVVEELDARIGEIFEIIKKAGLENDTLVVFCSDNGPNPGEAANCYPFRGEKWSALEGGTRVPCLVKWPGTITGNQTLKGLTSAMDLLPTLCDASGIDWESKTNPIQKIDGISLWQTWAEKADHPRKSLVLWHGHSPEAQAIRYGNWKLFFESRHALEGPGTARATGEQKEKLKAYRDNLKGSVGIRPMLFQLQNDPGETVDLTRANPEQLKLIKERADVEVAAIKKSPSLPLSRPTK